MLDAYEPLVRDAKDREMLAADRQIIESYEEVKTKVFTLSRGGKKPELMQWLIEQKSRLAKLGDAIDQHRQYNADFSRHAAEGAAHTRSNATRIGILMALVTLGLVASIGYILFRQHLVGGHGQSGRHRGRNGDLFGGAGREQRQRPRRGNGDPHSPANQFSPRLSQ